MRINVPLVRGLFIGILIMAVRQTGAASAAEHEAIAAAFAAYAPPLVMRAQWQAKPALPGLIAQTPTAIIIHHSGERRNLRLPIETKLRNLQAFSQRPDVLANGHRKPAWPDVPYHYYVDATGRIAEGRDVRFAGDTNTGYDTRGYIQVVVEGEFETETPSLEQLAAVERLLTWLMLSWNVAPAKVTVHKDHAPTDCPGRNFMAALPGLRARIDADRQRALANLCARPPDAVTGTTFCRGQ